MPESLAANIFEVLKQYNPWWSEGPEVDLRTPSFKRPLFNVLEEDLERIPQMLSVTGPRRIGKTILLKQMIGSLLRRGIEPRRIVYYDFGDPALERRDLDGGHVVDALMKYGAELPDPGPLYLFLDEIQRLDRWELFLKKYYDLKYPCRVVLSGSASSPIFKKSRESLLGRVKDYHLLPFSFREYALYHWRERADLVEFLDRIHDTGSSLQSQLTGGPAVPAQRVIEDGPPRFWAELEELLKRYMLEGGFPEVWALPDWVAKQEYLYDNQVKKVIYEDLVLAAEFRKPELLKRFYISLLEIPGQEVNVQAVAGKIGVNAQQIEKYLPLLEMTDLVYRVEKFRRSPIRVRRGRMKFYLVDLALRNAVLRLSASALDDSATLGLYAENLVFLALKQWRGTIQMDYYRDRDGEVDFIVHVGPRAYLPIEVKYRDSIQPEDFKSLHAFASRYGVKAPRIMVTKRFGHFNADPPVFTIPLPVFLVMFG